MANPCLSAKARRAFSSMWKLIEVCAGCAWSIERSWAMVASCRERLAIDTYHITYMRDWRELTSAAAAKVCSCAKAAEASLVM